ncbi:DUF4129 domain-containing protein [Saccharothrix obliqua]|uniref:DUF4129 domain-containing protein n=1 Tax=Saccharothrix obliqua TaxID=2861747 RepID=UPI001C5DE503|nr:DUF4129 domain-containing protein [Saccharothrix obliqua]MBW4719160.1 DUF4129 domain-containing protein [Saccharothrix obliqua]
MRPRLALALLVGAAVVVIAIAANGTSPVPYRDREPPTAAVPTMTQSTSKTADLDVPPSAAAGSLVAVLVVLAGAALVVVIGLLLTVRLPRRRRRGRGPVAVTGDEGGPDAPDALVRGAHDALREFRARTGGPPRDAVVAAWLRLERAAADSGAARQPHETPTEFTGALLARYRVDEAAAGVLRTTYQRARFGTADVTDEDARVAGDALEQVVRDLGAVRGDG